MRNGWHQSPQVAQLAGLPDGFMQTEQALQAFTGNAVLPGSQPYASAYSGHQFGVWAGQLGDGRAITVGETAAGWELQLKGAGPTPYSRGGDGRAWCCAPAFANFCAARPCTPWAFQPRARCA